MTEDPHGTGRRRRWLPVVGLALLVAGVIVVAVLLSRSGDAAPSAARSLVPTEPVAQGAVEDITRAIGKLEPVGRRTLVAGAAGTLTAISRRARVEFGESLATIDDQPVVLLRGSTPAWRAFEAGMTAGPDVLQLEQALQSMGHLIVEPDEFFRPATTAAIKRWQRARGLRATGVLPSGSIVFSPDPLRVLSRRAAVGTLLAPGDPLLDVSTGGKRVTVELRLADQRVTKRGRTVTVTLPDDSTTRGRVTSVGSPRKRSARDAEQAGASGGAQDGGSAGGATDDLVVPVAIRLVQPSAARRFEEGSVSVAFRTTVSRRALTVPVSALVALDPERFAVEVPGPDGSVRRIPVELGRFVGGRVVISGEGIHRGLRVAVAES